MNPGCRKLGLKKRQTRRLVFQTHTISSDDSDSFPQRHPPQLTGIHHNMPFSHHSHSGEFCPSHAQDTLEQVIQTAISQGMKVFCLSEHMPRASDELYDEEVLFH
jgi:hypothetical protein